MTFKTAIRSTHRVVSIWFTLAVAANFLWYGLQPDEPPAWITYGPLPPLFILLGTGLYLFVLPYVSRTKSPQGAS
jgi:membrane protein CcdC involved in cytochrome C biogenesis